MIAKWKCWVELLDGHRFSVRRPNGSEFLEGTAREALDFAARVRQFYEDRSVRSVEAHSVGPCPNIADLGLPRIVFHIRPHPNKRDWWVDESKLTHPCWLTRLDHAIGHVAFRGRGHLCEIQVLDSRGIPDSVVMVDQRGHNPFVDCAPGLTARSATSDAAAG
jgi:hypothetical protein